MRVRHLVASFEATRHRKKSHVISPAFCCLVQGNKMPATTTPLWAIAETVVATVHSRPLMRPRATGRPIAPRDAPLVRCRPLPLRPILPPLVRPLWLPLLLPPTPPIPQPQPLSPRLVKPAVVLIAVSLPSRLA